MKPTHPWRYPLDVARLGLVGGAMLFWGCATESAPVIQTPFAPATHRTIKIEPCVDRTGFSGARDLKEEATKILTEKVTALNLFEISSDAPLTLTCDIESFAEGNAMKRWVLPGSWGATQAVVAVVVRETPGDKVLAVLRSQASVKGGGLFSVGADQYILDVAFSDVVKQLEAWTKSP